MELAPRSGQEGAAPHGTIDCAAGPSRRSTLMSRFGPARARDRRGPGSRHLTDARRGAGGWGDLRAAFDPWSCVRCGSGVRGGSGRCCDVGGRGGNGLSRAHRRCGLRLRGCRDGHAGRDVPGLRRAGGRIRRRNDMRGCRVSGCGWCGRSRRQQRQGIDIALRITRHPNTEVDERFRPLDHTARADGSNDRSFGDERTARHGDRTEMNERHGVAERNLDRHGPAPGRDRPGKRHDTRRRREDRRAARRREIDAAVLAAGVRMGAIERERP